MATKILRGLNHQPLDPQQIRNATPLPRLPIPSVYLLFSWLYSAAPENIAPIAFAHERRQKALFVRTSIPPSFHVALRELPHFLRRNYNSYAAPQPFLWRASLYLVPDIADIYQV